MTAVLLDDVDRMLISKLSENARISISSLAQELKMARTTVQARIDRLEDSGTIMAYTIRIDKSVLERQIKATVLVQVAPKATLELIERLKNEPSVEVVHTTSGRFDLTIQLSAESTVTMDQTLDRIGELDGVQSLESLIHLSTRIDRTI